MLMNNKMMNILPLDAPTVTGSQSQLPKSKNTKSKNTTRGISLVNPLENEYIILSETIDVSALQKIIKHYDHLFPIIQKNQNKPVDSQTKKTLFTLLKNMASEHEKSSFVQKEYKFATGAMDGRMYTKNGLQGIAKVIRHTIGCDLYYDIDMDNAHPTILLHYCKRNNISPTTYLEQYISNRDSILSSMGPNRDNNKQLLLSILNGGGNNTTINKYQNTDFIYAYQDELFNIRDTICKLNPDIVAKIERRKPDPNFPNTQGRVVNVIMCKDENAILMTCYKYLKENEYTINVLVFDGFMMLKQNMSEHDVNSLMRDLETVILNEHNIPIKLSSKPMTKFRLDLSDLDNSNKDNEINNSIPLDLSSLSYIQDNSSSDIDEMKILLQQVGDKNFSGDISFAKLFRHVYGKKYIRLDKWDKSFTFCWDKYSLLWVKQPINFIQTIIPSVLRPYLDVLATSYKPADDVTNQEHHNLYHYVLKLYRYLNCLSSVKSVCESFINESIQDNIEFNELINKSADEIPIKGGLVLNLKDSSIHLRTELDLFSFELNYSYNKSYNKDIVINFFKDITRNDTDYIHYFHLLIGSFLSGDITGRNLHIAWGGGRNGKSTLVNIIKKILTKDKNNSFFTTLSETALMSCASKSAGSANPEVMPLVSARLAVLSEIDKNEELNAKRVKTLTGGDSLSARPLYGNQITFDTQAKFILPTNHKPSFDVKDVAMVDRIRLLPFLQRFEDTPENKSKIENIMDYHINDFFCWFVDGAKLWYEQGRTIKPCAIMDSEMTVYMRSLDFVIQFLDENYECTKSIYSTLSDKDPKKKNYRTKRSSIYDKFRLLDPEKCKLIDRKAFFEQVSKVFEAKKCGVDFYLCIERKEIDETSAPSRLLAENSYNTHDNPSPQIPAEHKNSTETTNYYPSGMTQSDIDNIIYASDHESDDE
jgi:P4 family phage/plasmid primase-like protien